VRDDRYVPDAGHIVWLTFDPQVGREQGGRRPALVLSRKAYNERVGLAVVCPVTSRIKGYPFEVRIPDALAVDGVVLSDQVKSLDWRGRRAEYADTAEDTLLTEVREKVRPLLGL